MADKDRYDPIFASECTVYCLVENAGFESFIADISNATEGRFFVRIYKTGALQWTGKLLQDKIRKADQYFPYDFTISFTDGIGALKDIDFDNGGVLYNGRENFIGIICKILGKTGIQGLFGTNDSFLKTCVHWYDAHHNFYANWDPLKYSDVDHAAFYNYENEANEPKACYDVLSEILYTFGCHLKQAAGVFQIVQPNEYINNYLMTRTYSKSGIMLSYNYYENYRTDYTVFSRMVGGIYSYFPSLYYVKRKYIYKQSPQGSNIIPEQTAYDPAVDFLSGLSGGNNEYLTFSGSVNEIYTLNQYQSGAWRVKYRIDIIITKGDGTKRYLTNGSNGNGAIVWSADSAQYMTFWSDCGLDPTLYYNDFFEINFTTPAIPWDATGTFRFRKLGYYDMNGNVFTIIGGISFSFTCCEFLLEMIYQNQVVSAGEITFTANNTTYGDKSKKIDVPNAFIGDGPYTLSLGRIKTYDGSTWINSTVWSIKTGSQQKKIHQLLVDEIMLGQQVPCDIYEGSLCVTVYSAEKCLVFSDNTVWVPLSISYAAYSDAWTGQWWKMKLQSSSPQTGLYLEAGNYDPAAEWYLKAWDSEPVDEEETDDPSPLPVINEQQYRIAQLINKLQAFTDLMSITRLTTAVTEGDNMISLDVSEIADQILASGDRVMLINTGDGITEEVQLDALQSAGDTTLTIVAHTFVNSFPMGTRIIFNIYNLIKKLNGVWILAGGTWNDDGTWQDSETWQDS
jgi:hypothetical protein